ncbi:pentatricopeptide repeat-containing protein [Senna tora]|uniref:Pentatricopeptide repeat-containing protein n=1 Tax=Senna tora TaxID=362788 RepID=A0A834T852_9FABA|nr:pentatricopeptide repeat-containing protein [Senna tora]
MSGMKAPGDIIEGIGEDDRDCSFVSVKTRSEFSAHLGKINQKVELIWLKVRRGNKTLKLRARIVQQKNSILQRKYTIQAATDPRHIADIGDLTLEQCTELQEMSKKYVDVKSKELRRSCIKYDWKMKVEKHLPDQCCSVVSSVLFMPLEGEHCVHTTTGRCMAWFSAAVSSGVPLVFVNIQTEQILHSEKTNVWTRETGRSKQQNHNTTNQRMQGIRLWYLPGVAEMSIELIPRRKEVCFGMEIKRTEEGFLCINSVMEGSAAERAGVRQVCEEATESGFLLVMSRLDGKSVMPSTVCSAAMAVPLRSAVAKPACLPPNPSLVTSITSLLQTLNPQNPHPSNLTSQPLQQFSSHLNPTLVIHVVNNQTNPYHALFFFNWASNPQPNPNNYSHTHSCYLAITDLLLSHSLFSTAFSLLHNSHNLSDFIIARFIKAFGDRGDIRGAIHWFHKVKSFLRGRCLFSYNAILGVLVRANRVNLANAFYDQIVKEGVVKPNVYTYTTMIRGFCKMGMLENARKVFDEMKCDPNLITYNTMINVFCKKGEMESARRVFDRMLESKNCMPDVVTYTTLIDGYCKKGELHEAMKCMTEMAKQGCQPNVLTYNALVEGLCLNGNVDEGKRMMTRMRLNGLKDNVVTHTSILKGFCIVGKSDEAIKHMKEMVSLGMNPDVKSYGIIINEYCKIRKPYEAISLLREMRARSIKPSVSSFNAVFRVLVDLGKLQEAIVLLKQMPQMGCSPNFLSYSTVICGLCEAKGRMQEAEELVRDMVQNGHNLDATMYSCLLRGYCEEGKEEMALQTVYDIISNNYVINLESFSTFVKKLCAKGYVKEVETIYEEMRRRCPVPEPDASAYKMVLLLAKMS